MSGRQARKKHFVLQLLFVALFLCIHLSDGLAFQFRNVEGPCSEAIREGTLPDLPGKFLRWINVDSDTRKDVQYIRDLLSREKPAEWTSSELLYFKGIALCLCGKMDAAFNNFRSCQECDFDAPFFTSWFAFVQAHLHGNFAWLVSFGEAESNQVNEDPWLCGTLGEIYFSKKCFDKSYRYLVTSLHGRPENERWRIHAIRSASELRHLEAVIHHYKELIFYHPKKYGLNLHGEVRPVIDAEYGRAQVAQMIKDRPSMEWIAYQGNPIYDWVVDGFAGLYLPGKVRWRSEKLDGTFSFACNRRVLGVPDVFGELYVCNMPELFGCEGLWAFVVFELFNLQLKHLHFENAMNAQRHLVNREQYVHKKLEIELIARRNTSAMYVTEFWPKLKQAGCQPNPQLWLIDMDIDKYFNKPTFVKDKYSKQFDWLTGALIK